VSFLKKIGDKVKDTATTVGSKSADMLESGKLKIHKSQLEGKIKDKKTEIGNIIYEAYKQNTPADSSALEEIYNEIKDLEDQIEAIDVKLQKEAEQPASHEAQTTAYSGRSGRPFRKHPDMKPEYRDTLPADLILE